VLQFRLSLASAGPRLRGVCVCVCLYRKL